MLCFEGPLQFQLQLPSCMFSACAMRFVPIYALRPAPVKGSCLWGGHRNRDSTAATLNYTAAYCCGSTLLSQLCPDLTN